jgi:spermidine/putrescine transport system ATP-binding protein
MQVELRQLHKSVGITTIFVTHDQEEALTLSDRITVLNEGTIQQIGPPTEIYERPMNRFVSNFIGVSNFIKGEVTVSDGRITKCRLSDDYEIRILTKEVFSAKAKVKLAIRPEKMRILSKIDSTAENYLSGKVKNIVYLGTTTQYFICLKSDETVVIYQQNEGRLERETFRIGDEVYLPWLPESTLIISN